MKLTSAMIKEAAFAAGAADVGIGNIERWDNAPERMHPRNIFPECKSVISTIGVIPRGTYRGITEGTHWANYTYYAYNRLNTLYRPLATFDTACFIEDHGWEAVPLYPGVPERPNLHDPVAPGRPPRDIFMQVRIQATACGLGEPGWSKVFLSNKFGPRVRIGTILTDAELEPDPLVEPGTLCNKCMKCVVDCPGGAIPRPKDRDPIRIQIEDKTYEWGDVHMGRCTLTHHGLNREASPFLKKDLPGFEIDVRNSNMSEESAYRMTYPMAQARWNPSPEAPTNAVIGYYRQMLDHVGYFAVCGARGCIRACMEGMEKRECIDQSEFPTAVFPRGKWELPPACEDETGGIAEGKFAEEFNEPAKAAGQWD